jgi:hypothetical protein
MAAHTDELDVLESLAAMRPDLDELGRSWPAEQRQAVLDEVLSVARTAPRRSASRWIGAGIAVAAATAATLLLLPTVVGLWQPAGSVPAVPAPTVPTAAGSSTTPVDSPSLACTTPSSQDVSYALMAFEDGYERGWWAAAMAGDVLALEVPVFDGLEPVDVTIQTIRVLELGSADDEAYGPVTDPNAEAAAIDCLYAAEPLPPRPELSCQPADLANLEVRPNQELPLTVAYGSRIVDSAAVNTGDGFTIVAARLAEPTGPEGADKVAWLMREGDGRGWVVTVSPAWMGQGGPDNRAIPWGPLARATAIGCVS